MEPERHPGELLEAIQLADEVGLDVVGIGGNITGRIFLDSAPTMILAAAARMRRIRLRSAVKALSAADPVRVFVERGAVLVTGCRQSGYLEGTFPIPGRLLV